MLNGTKTVVIGDIKVHSFGFHQDQETQRRMAVATALELIKSSCVGQGYTQLGAALNDLESMATQIQQVAQKSSR